MGKRVHTGPITGKCHLYNHVHAGRRLLKTLARNRFDIAQYRPEPRHSSRDATAGVVVSWDSSPERSPDLTMSFFLKSADGRYDSLSNLRIYAVIRSRRVGASAGQWATSGVRIGRLSMRLWLDPAKIARATWSRRSLERRARTKTSRSPPARSASAGSRERNSSTSSMPQGRSDRARVRDIVVKNGANGETTYLRESRGGIGSGQLALRSMLEVDLP